MGTKRKRVIMQAGSLLNPIFRYILKMNFVANPTDIHGTRLLRHLQYQTMNLNKKLHQPNFESTYRESVECISSKWEIKFVNGWERTFYMKYADMSTLHQTIRQYNHFIEGQRALQGEDDEPDDTLLQY
ncbi:unnamed protein product [Paramecium octaurelia]|uniref:Uncharacterized protein n=1 Tax=Paramecium octaurelia TaxID=43137 RepID=A0A8S1S6I2_PAROT|nr:unnamed protein product [Paramecium octaurelia]CAD8139802.1 unnamed protein product [Paramecium octaurelia]